MINTISILKLMAHLLTYSYVDQEYDNIYINSEPLPNYNPIYYPTTAPSPSLLGEDVQFRPFTSLNPYTKARPPAAPSPSLFNRVAKYVSSGKFKLLPRRYYYKHLY